MNKGIKSLGFFAFLLLGAVQLHAQGASKVTRLDPALDKIISADAKIEKVAGNFSFAEGPLWVRSGNYLLFSDIPANVINKMTQDGKVSVYLKPSGFTGSDASDVGAEIDNGHGIFTLIGSNGVTLDRQGRINFSAHGDHAIIRIEKNGKRTVLADKFDGKRLNSPNDLVYKSDGGLYFTDPTAGLRKRNDDPKRELPYTGVYLLKNGKLQLLDKSFTLPNGIAFSPDEKYLYVDDTTRKIVMRFEVQPDGTISNGKVFSDMTADSAPGVPDGLKVDQNGNVFCTGPGGVWIISPEGKHLGTINLPEVPANVAFGGDDGKSLFLTARTSIYRVHTMIAGIRP